MIRDEFKILWISEMKSRYEKGKKLLDDIDKSINNVINYMLVGNFSN